MPSPQVSCQTPTHDPLLQDWKRKELWNGDAAAVMNEFVSYF
ncbi:Uncharacterised protein [Vibrio cholerae]|nr:Uncharacterised protein [Vibrio cholerae]